MKIRSAFLMAWLVIIIPSWSDAQELLPNELPQAPTVSQPIGNPRPWSLTPLSCMGPGEGCGWIKIMLVDFNGDGKDDLCGYYGIIRPTSRQRLQFGCVSSDASNDFLRFTDQFINVSALSQALLQASPETGKSALSPYRRVYAVAINSGPNGAPDHLCARMANGISCVGFNNGTFSNTAALMQESFSDSNGWDTPYYEETIGFPVIANVRAVCGRGKAGIHCFRFNASTNQFSDPVVTQESFADRYGWKNPQYYSTIRYVDINGDGNSDICGRGSDGLLCATYSSSDNWFGDQHRDAKWWTRQFRDSYGWNTQNFYSSIIYLDLNGNGRSDVCGRGYAGLYCGLTNSQRFRFALNPPAVTGINWTPSKTTSLYRIERNGYAKVCEVVSQQSTGTFDLMCAQSTTPRGQTTRLPTFSAVANAMRGEAPAIRDRLVFGSPRRVYLDWACWVNKWQNGPVLPGGVWCGLVL